VALPDPTTLKIDKSDPSLYEGADRPGAPCLIVYTGPDPGRRIDLEPGTLGIGRAGGAPVRITAPGISRHHAELDVGDDTVVLRDLGSANGSRVNDQRVQAPVTLRDGDFIRLADVVLKFHSRLTLEVALHERIYRLATVDPGTGVFNRRHFDEVLEREIRRARLSQRPLAIVCYDLDHFKQVNDRHGHPAGDRVLKESAAAVHDVLRGSDVLCRMGGEEFAVLMPHTTREDACAVAERIRAEIAARVFKLPTAAGLVEHRQTISLGVAVLAPPLESAADLIEAADRSLYEAKRGGRNRVGA
jgi:two-component system cell cycle response regulator